MTALPPLVLRVVALVLAGFTLPLRAQEPVGVDAWREDLRALATELPKRHKNAFAILSEEAFTKRVALADARLGELDDLRAAVELAKIAAALEDGHTGLAVPALAEGPLPLRIWRWKDGYFVFQAPASYEGLAGGRIVKVGALPIAEVEARVRSLDASDNPAALEVRTAFRLVQPRALFALGIVDSMDAVPLTVVKADGSEAAFVVAAGARAKDDVAVVPAKPPITNQQRAWHHHVHLADEGLLYLQFNACATSKEQDLDAFGDRMKDILDQGGVRTLVIDLQYNGGGNSRLGDALFAKLADAEPMKSRRNLFAVIGRQTYSSAILNAVTLKQRYGFVLVGASTGGSPNHFGEVRTFTLPRSKLVLSYSTKRFELGPKDATTLAPDHEAAATFSEWSAGQDAVLDAIRRLVKP